MTSHSEAPHPPVIDLEVIETLKELGGDDEPNLWIEVIDLYLEDAGQRVQVMSRASSSGDHQQVSASAHALKSASANVGANGFAAICQSIEAAVRDSEDLDGLVERCTTAYEAVAARLIELRQSA